MNQRTKNILKCMENFEKYGSQDKPKVIKSIGVDRGEKAA